MDAAGEQEAAMGEERPRMRSGAEGAPGGGGGGLVERVAPLGALALANGRFWPTVAPVASRELRRWRAPAQEIPDAKLRALALWKLENESFNAQVAATLATLTPRRARERTVQAIVALELLFDYLDGRTEELGHGVLLQAPVLFAAFTTALDLEAAREQAGRSAPGEALPDWRYLTALSARVRESLLAVGPAQNLAPVATHALARCAQAQTRIHALEVLGSEQLRRWASETGDSSGLGWREYAAGCASSVLAAHALIAVSADPTVRACEAQRLDDAYLVIGAAITILDSLVDAAEDGASGRAGLLSLFEPGELHEIVPALVREALSRTRAAPNSAHHAMTLAGVIAYYTSHPGAREGEAAEIVPLVRAELSPTVWPALGVMRLWRVAKRVRERTCSGEETPPGRQPPPAEGEHA